MGGTASALVTALTLPPTTSVAWVRSFAAGIVGAVRHLGAPDCRVAGGDLGTGGRVHAAVTVLGSATSPALAEDPLNLPEALNDLFSKYGKPEIAPLDDAASR